MIIDLLYKAGKLAGQLLLLKKFNHIPKVEGDIPESGSQIFVANHLPEYRGPFAAVSAIPYRIYPWAGDVWMDRDDAIKHAQDGFFFRRYGDSILSKVGGFALGSFLSWALNAFEAIPVYRDRETEHGTRRINETYIRTAIKLHEHKPILVFPEYTCGEPDSHGLWPFKYGFTKIPEYYFVFGEDSLDYYAMGICHITGNVMIAPRYTVYKEDFIMGHPKTRANRRQLKEDLENKIRDMCSEMN